MGYVGEAEWMNNDNAMIGFTTQHDKWKTNGFMAVDKADNLIKPWWATSQFKLAYPGAIPVEDVERHLLFWEPQSSDVAVKMYLPNDETGEYAEAHGEDEGGHFIWVADEDTQAITRFDNRAVFGYFGKDSYKVHKHNDLLAQCSNLVDGELGIGSAYLMFDGAVFVLNMELPEDITTEQGISHRIKLMACTSSNGKYTTMFKIVDEFSVCYNSFTMQLNGSGNEFRVKHTSQSLGKINDARTALGLVYKAAEEYSAFIDGMTQVEVTDAKFKVLVAGLFPVPDPDVKMGKTGKLIVGNQISITNAENRQARLIEMWNTAPEVKPFNGTLFGALQAYSTWNQWERPNKVDMQAQLVNVIGSKSGNTGIDKADADFFAIVAGMDLNLGALVPSQ